MKKEDFIFKTGCSGWQYQEWRNRFYPLNLPIKKWLEFYAQKFNTVEINSSFYHFPAVTTLQYWKEAVPNDFHYSLKANRSITHYHKFDNTETIIKDFYRLSDILGEKLGYILFQLPATIEYNELFLQKMIKQLSIYKKNVIEFRHISWWQPQVINTLAERNIIFANINTPTLNVPLQPTGNVLYLRFHGQKQWYKDEYGEKYLSEWMDAIKATSAREVWCYFDNTMDGSAIKDAFIWKSIEQVKEVYCSE